GMPLVRLEVFNFKSYRGLHVIGPFKNFTCIIGPNGSGKSNVMDAISFVLGVRSMYLRSNDKTDFIYRGRRLAKAPDEPSLPVDDNEELDNTDGTSAWVMAVYVDQKGNEIRFKRTVSLEGSSEYRLNNRVVTYKHYNEALQRENILVQAKNFLVFQGDVEAIASQSPKDLTKLIERISGSAELAREYEEAKKAQEKATESSTFNFTKRRGIMAEIKQFKEQKSEADKFEKLLDERTIDNNIESIEKKNGELAGLKAELTQQEDNLAKAQQEQARARGEVMKQEKSIKKQERILESKRKIQNAQKISEEVKRDAAKEQQHYDQLKRNLADVKKAADAAAKVQEKSAQSDFKLTERHLEEYQALKATANSHAVNERHQREKLKRDEKIGKRSLENLETKQEEFDKKQTTLMQDYDLWKEKLATCEEKLGKLKTDIKGVKQELDKNQAERTKISKLEGEVNEKLQNIHNQLLQASADQRESERDRVRGRLVDLCKPSARKYDLAVSVALGRNIDAIVVDSEKTCIECIEYMRSQRSGQATFIPLDTIKVKPINDRLRSLSKGARLAVEVVLCDPSVERAVHHACGNALICDTMEIARHISYDRGQDVKAVTLDGTVIHKSGLITGGRSSQNSGKTWEEKEIQSMQRTRDELLAQMRDLNKSKPRTRVDETLSAELNRLESEVTIAREERNAARTKVDDIKKELKHIHEALEKLVPEIKKGRATQAKLESDLEKLQAVIDEAEDGIFRDFCQKIRVSNIRDYEDHQLKAAQGEAEARLRFDSQIARLTH
ncbi:475_t:CDS:10, partial [Acaulospora colombiana]